MGLGIGVAVVSTVLLGIATHAAAAGRLTCTAALTPQIVAIARKWARVRGLPVAWVLATIQIESGGQTCRVGDAGGRSVGLMQVNTVAHADMMRKMGLSYSDLLRPDQNIRIGTQILRNRWELVHAATGGQSTVPIGTLVALAYRGPERTVEAIRSGGPLPYPERAARWNTALSETAPLV